jgi:hypothetical protein
MPNVASVLRSRRARLVLLLALLTLGAAAAQAPSPAALDGLDARAAVELANAWKGSEVTSFATADAVHFAFPSGEEVRIAMPSDEMFVSVAPYLNRTHPCGVHSMSGCQGELVDAPIRVEALAPDGSVLIDEVRSTGRNGFLDLWLPRGQVVALRLSWDGFAAMAPVATFADSPTCITTMQLAPAGG